MESGSLFPRVSTLMSSTIQSTYVLLHDNAVQLRQAHGHNDRQLRAINLANKVCKRRMMTACA